MLVATYDQIINYYRRTGKDKLAAALYKQRMKSQIKKTVTEYESGSYSGPMSSPTKPSSSRSSGDGGDSKRESDDVSKPVEQVDEKNILEELFEEQTVQDMLVRPVVGVEDIRPAPSYVTPFTPSRPGTTATPMEQMVVGDRRPVGVSTPITEQQQQQRSFYFGRQQAEQDASSRIDEIRPVYEQEIERRYDERTSVDYRDVGMVQQDGSWVFTDESQIQALESRGYVVETDEQGNISVYNPGYINEIQQGVSPRFQQEARGIYRDEYAEEDIMMVEQNGDLVLVPGKQFREQQQFESTRETIRSRVRGEEGIGPQLGEGARFVSSVFIRPGDFGAVVADLIQGEPERALDVMAKRSMELDTLNPVELFVESYKPGGFGFLATTAALTVGIGGAAGGVLAGAGVGGRVLATGIPLALAGGSGALIGAELGITKNLEDMGELPSGSTAELLGRRTAEFGVAYGAGTIAALGGPTYFRGIQETEYPGSFGYRKTVGVGKYQRPYGPEVFSLEQLGMGTGFEPTYPGVVPYTPKTPSTFIYNMMDPMVQSVFFPSVKPIRTTRGIYPGDIEKMDITEPIPKSDALTVFSPKYLEEPRVFMEILDLKDIVEATTPQQTAKAIITGKGTPKDLQRPLSYRSVSGTGFEPDIEKYIGSQLKDRDVPVDFMGTPKDKRVPISYRKLVGKPGLDFETYAGKIIEKEIGTALSTKVLPKPMLYEEFISYVTFTESGRIVGFEDKPYNALLREGKTVKMKPLVSQDKDVVDVGSKLKDFSKQLDNIGKTQTQKTGTQTIQIEKQEQVQKPVVETKQKSIMKRSRVSLEELEQLGRFELDDFVGLQSPDIQQLSGPAIGQRQSSTLLFQSPLVQTMNNQEQQIINQMQTPVVLPVQAQFENQLLNQINNQVVLQGSIQGSIMDQVFDTAQLQVETQIQNQMQQVDVGTQLNINSILETVVKPQKGLLLDTVGETFGVGDSQAYDVYVKKRQFVNGKRIRGTEWEKINRHPLSEFDAKSLGSHRTDNTAKRTFKIVKTEGEPRKLRKKVTPWDMQMLEYNQRGKNKYVEDVMFAIDSPGELDEITERGIAARSGKKVDIMKVRGMGDIERKVNGMMRRMVI